MFVSRLRRLLLCFVSLLPVSFPAAAQLVALSGKLVAPQTSTAIPDLRPLTRLTGHLPAWANAARDAGAAG